MKKITQIEGIGEVYCAKLNEVGIVSVEQYLEACKTKKDRKALAEKTGIPESQILLWANHADLFRIKGVAGQYADHRRHRKGQRGKESGALCALPQNGEEMGRSGQGTAPHHRILIRSGTPRRDAFTPLFYWGSA